MAGDHPLRLRHHPHRSLSLSLSLSLPIATAPATSVTGSPWQSGHGHRTQFLGRRPSTGAPPRSTTVNFGLIVISLSEKGEIFFFFRPKVEKEEAHSSEDVQRLYIVLRPEEIENKHESSHESSSTAAASPKKRKIIKNRNANGAHGETPSPKQRQAADESEKNVVQEVDTQKQILMRLMVMGKKIFPDPHEKSRRPYWGFVEMVTTNIDDLKNALKGENMILRQEDTDIPRPQEHLAKAFIKC